MQFTRYEVRTYNYENPYDERMRYNPFYSLDDATDEYKRIRRESPDTNVALCRVTLSEYGESVKVLRKFGWICRC